VGKLMKEYGKSGKIGASGLKANMCCASHESPTRVARYAAMYKAAALVLAILWSKFLA
jgi:hypothetical protein